MIERVFNAPIALLFLIIGMSYLLGKQKIRGSEPGFWSHVCCSRAQVNGSIASGVASECRSEGSQMTTLGLQEARTCLPMCC